MKRIVFILLLAILSIVCILKMNEQYDELARYPHVLSESQRKIVLEHLTMDEINYLVSQKIEPDQFLPYIQDEQFILKNTLWYDLAMQTRKGEHSEVISFINQYRQRFTYENLGEYLKYYTYDELMRFCDNEAYLSLCKKVNDPYLVLQENETLFTYEPTHLVEMKELPFSDQLPLSKHYLKENVIVHLQELLTQAKESNDLKYGNLEIVCGYLSYDQQLSLLEEEHELLKDIELQAGGQSELQLGYSVLLTFNEETIKDEEECDKAKQDAFTYLKNQCAKHGFTLRNIYDDQWIEIRYVGMDIAMELYEQKLSLEEIDLEKFNKK